ncbi:hypothetical protein CONLIGDRAFT_673303 [Coniochaeta ligniaria NRRL 30616]|uniref:Uncharacterized protein n=1 Tax=Coniochaeta ligniaria NRRL 30616 TaxID=1408157 RepID=A0A1J7J5S7_9PEZI|nr:hypothetical protein CONLIGDRAFT_673303 [Coniochaeta ligniaria NRRL 30616]
MIQPRPALALSLSHSCLLIRPETAINTVPLKIHIVNIINPNKAGQPSVAPAAVGQSGLEDVSLGLNQTFFFDEYLGLWDNARSLNLKVYSSQNSVLVAVSARLAHGKYLTAPQTSPEYADYATRAAPISPNDRYSQRHLRPWPTPTAHAHGPE